MVRFGDPDEHRADLLDTGTLTVDDWPSSHTGTLATIKVQSVVTGHILGAIAAFRALKLLPLRHQLTGLFGLLTVTVSTPAPASIGCPEPDPRHWRMRARES